jgi:hypothetical protein
MCLSFSPFYDTKSLIFCLVSVSLLNSSLLNSSSSFSFTNNNAYAFVFVYFSILIISFKESLSFCYADIVYSHFFTYSVKNCLVFSNTSILASLSSPLWTLEDLGAPLGIVDFLILLGFIIDVILLLVYCMILCSYVSKVPSDISILVLSLI